MPKSKKIKKEISIFRTSVSSRKKVKKIKPILDALIGSGNWNFDLEDKDYILRINSSPVLNNFLAREIKNMGFDCTEIY